MSKVTQVYYNFVTPNNKCVKTTNCSTNPALFTPVQAQLRVLAGEVRKGVLDAGREEGPLRRRAPVSSRGAIHQFSRIILNSDSKSDS
jgi:hypothetical protein